MHLTKEERERRNARIREQTDAWMVVVNIFLECATEAIRADLDELDEISRRND